MAVNQTTIAGRPAVIEVQDTITRLTNATQYADGDAISDHATTPTAAGYFVLDVGGQPGASGMFLDFTLHKSDHDETSADFDLLLFTTLPALAGFEDNVALAITAAEMKDCKGVVRFVSADWSNVVTGDIQTVSKTIGFVCASGSVTIYGILFAAGTYTPASGEVLTLTAKAIQD